MRPKLEVIAVNFLLDDYLRSSHFRYIQQLYSYGHDQKCLDLVVKAVGIASLAARTGQHDLQIRAREYHIKGVNTLKTALEDQQRATTDEVLAAVLLLSLYETLNRHTTADMEAWGSHIRGALALLTLRGTAQFTSRFGLIIFTQTSKMIMMFCIQNRLKMPPELQKLTAVAQNHRDGGLHGVLDAAQFVEDFVELKADVTNGVLSSSTIIIRAQRQLNLMNDFITLFYNFSTRPSDIARTETPWSSPYQFQAWSNIRMAQMELNTIMCTEHRRLHSLHGPCSTTPSPYCRNVIQAAEDIYHVVSQLFPEPPPHHHGDSPTPTPPRPPQNQDPAAGYFSIWPLHNAGSCRCVDASFRTRVVAKLEHVAAVTALPQAQAAAETLAAGSAEHWMHVYHVF